jgi:hypothetical protein
VLCIRNGTGSRSLLSVSLTVPSLLLSLSVDKQENRRPLAHECLGEVLRVLRQVISTYPLLNTVETLTAAGKLISKVKGKTTGWTNQSSTT